MEFRKELTTNEITQYNLDTNPVIKWYWVTVDEEDMKHRIYRYVRAQPNNSQWDWHKITQETCLEKFAEFLISIDFQCKDDFLQNHVNQIKSIFDNFDIKKLLDPNKPWQYISHDKSGPFMIWDGVHRQTAAFIYYFIKNNSKFVSVSHAVCGISSSNDGDLGRIPNYFCY